MRLLVLLSLLIVGVSGRIVKAYDVEVITSQLLVKLDQFTSSTRFSSKVSVPYKKTSVRFVDPSASGHNIDSYFLVSISGKQKKCLYAGNNKFKQYFKTGKIPSGFTQENFAPELYMSHFDGFSGISPRGFYVFFSESSRESQSTFVLDTRSCKVVDMPNTEILGDSFWTSDYQQLVYLDYASMGPDVYLRMTKEGDIFKTAKSINLLKDKSLKDNLTVVGMVLKDSNVFVGFGNLGDKKIKEISVFRMQDLKLLDTIVIE